MTSNMIYIVAFGVGLKCPCKIHLNTQCPTHAGPQFMQVLPLQALPIQAPAPAGHVQFDWV